jgi:hypothetical protein
MLYEKSLKTILAIHLIFNFVSKIEANWDPASIKLAPKDNIGAAAFGQSLILTTNNQTVIIGGPYDNSMIGAIWVYQKNSSNNWNNTTSIKLPPTNYVGNQILFGFPLVLTTDNKYLAAGGSKDHNDIGAVWVYKKENENWDWNNPTKLVPPYGSFTGQPSFGSEIAFTNNSKFSAIGGNQDNNGMGAAWIYKKENDNWNTIPTKLIPTNTLGTANFGSKITFTNDNNYLAVGGYHDNNNTGAVWIYRKDNSDNWINQAKLQPTDIIGQAWFGVFFAFSNDNNYLAIGGPGDNSDTGAVWIYKKNDFGDWNTTPVKPSHITHTTGFGFRLAFSNDNNSLAIGWCGGDASTEAVCIYQKNSGV